MSTDNQECLIKLKPAARISTFLDKVSCVFYQTGYMSIGYNVHGTNDCYFVNYTAGITAFMYKYPAH